MIKLVHQQTYSFFIFLPSAPLIICYLSELETAVMLYYCNFFTTYSTMVLRALPPYYPLTAFFCLLVWQEYSSDSKYKGEVELLTYVAAAAAHKKKKMVTPKVSKAKHPAKKPPKKKPAK